MKALKLCNICGNDDVELIAQTTRYDVKARTVVCKNCGLVFIDDHQTANDLQKYYDKSYREQYVSVDLEGEENIQRKKEKAIELKEILTKSVNVLEVGCASGILLEECKKVNSNINLYGVEPTTELANKAISKGINVFCGFIENFEDKKNLKFDCIVLDHVLEHFIDPLAVLRKLRSIISKTGYLCVEIPDILCPYSDLEFGFFQHVHLYNFSFKTLKLIFALAGFKIIIKQKGVYLNVVAMPCESYSIEQIEMDTMTDDYRQIIKFLTLYKNTVRYKVTKQGKVRDVYLQQCLAVDVDVEKLIYMQRLKLQKAIVKNNIFENKDEQIVESVKEYLEILDITLPELIEYVKTAASSLETVGNVSTSLEFKNMING